MTAVSAPPPPLRIHAFERRSRANGPGTRSVVWVQGCTLGCAGCFNPATHPTATATAMAIADLGDLVDQIPADVDGFTLSGGEPLQQPAAAAALLELVRTRRPSLSTLVFSGYTLDEIRAIPDGPHLLTHVDVLIDGRYQPRRHLGAGLRGSANQRIHLLTTRHTLAEVEATPTTEIRITPDGQIVLTGVDPFLGTV